MLSEHKLEVLRTVEASELPVREVLDQSRDPPVDLLSVETPLPKEGVGRLAGPSPRIRTGLESDPAQRTGPNPGDGAAVSRVVPTRSELPGDG